MSSSNDATNVSPHRYSIVPKDYLVGGNCTFTLVSSEDEHKTYKIFKPRSKEYYKIGLLIGSNNDKDYKFFGTVNKETGQIVLFHGTDFTTSTEAVQLANLILSYSFANKPLPEGLYLQTSSKCGRCGRTLTAPPSENPYFPWFGGECGAM